MPKGRVVIVGAGHGGATAAVELRARGHGGEVLLLSDEPVAPYERPPLSKGWLTSPGGAKPPLYDEATLAARRVTFRSGVRVAGIDRDARRLRTEDAEAIAYDALVLATGSRARRLPVPGAGLPGVHTLRTAADADALRAELRAGARLVVVGAGYVGLEVAASARRLGCAVTIAELAPRPLARTASARVADHFQRLHEAHGVAFLFEDGVAAVEGAGGRAAGVTLGSGRHLPADAVLVAVGGVPDTALAEGAGLDCANGILVDEASRTSDPAVYAVGDATSRPSPFAPPGEGGRVRLESVHNALEQARLAAADLTATPPPRIEAPWFWSDQYDTKLQIAGLVRAGDEQVVRTGPSGLAVFHLRGGGLRAVEAANDPVAYMLGRKALTAGRGVDAAVLADPDADLRAALL